MLPLLERTAPSTERLSRPRTALIWIALAAVLFLTAHGIYANGLLKQTFWLPSGLARLGYAALAWTAWSLIFAFAAPRWFVPATSAVLIVLTGAALGLLPVFAVVLFLFSCYVTGSLLLRGSQPAEAVSALLKIILGLSVWMAVTGVLVHFPVNYPAVYVLMLAAPLAIRPALTLSCASEAGRLLRPSPEYSWSDRLLRGLAGFPILCQLLVTYKPEVGADALAVHLMVPAWVSNHHLWPFDVTHISWAVMPLGADWCYTIAYMLGGEYAARLLNFAAFLAICGMVYAVSVRYAGRGPAAFFAGLFASTPIVQLVTGSLFIENLWALLLFGVVVALDRFHHTRAVRWLYVAAALLGAGLATKFGTFALLVPASGVIAWQIVNARKEPPGARKTALGVICLILVFGAAPYAFAWAKTGNPFFPFFNSTFQSPYYGTEPFTTKYSQPFTPLAPYNAVFHTHNHLEGYDGALGFSFLLLAALGLVTLRRKSPFLGLVSLGLALAFSGLTFAGQAYVRYLHPALPMLAVAGAVAFGEMRAHKALTRAVMASLAAVLLLNVYFLPASGYYHADFCINPFNRKAVEEYLTGVPGRKIIAYLNRTHPGEPVAFFDAGEIAGLKGRAYVMGWHNERYVRKVWLATDAAAYGRLAQSLGVSLFIVPKEWAQSPPSTPVQSFLIRYTDYEYGSGRLELRRVKRIMARDLASVKPPGPCDTGMLDDRAPQIRYTGAWRALERFGSSCSGTLTYTDAEDATVSMQFTGTSVTWIHTRAYTRGAAEILIDGVKRDVVDLFSPEIEWRSRLTFGGLAPGRHTLTIRVLHAKAVASQGYDIDVDGFVVH